MCEPTTIIMLTTLAVSAASAYVTMDGQNAMVEQQAETANSNTREAYRVAQENDRSAQAQAFESQTDRQRQAAQQLSLARVVAAEGGGSLASRAININAGAAEDYSRIDASLQNQRSSVRGQMAAAQVQNQQAMSQASAAFKANQIGFVSSVAGAAMEAGGSYYQQSAVKKKAKGYTPATGNTAWFSGNNGMGD